MSSALTSRDMPFLSFVLRDIIFARQTAGEQAGLNREKERTVIPRQQLLQPAQPRARLSKHAVKYSCRNLASESSRQPSTPILRSNWQAERVNREGSLNRVTYPSWPLGSHLASFHPHNYNKFDIS